MRPKSHFSSAVSFLFIIAMVWHAFTSQTPTADMDKDLPATEWSTYRAMQHIKHIAVQPHYTGSKGNQRVRGYLKDQLSEMGLQPNIQEGYALDNYGNMARPVNIMARIKGSGSGQALLLLSHYDSDPHSALGASDAGSGVATVLEGVRAFLAKKQKPINDIIILFTDAEELGLSGAQLFVDEHPWAAEVGMVLNFEARGSGGPSYMLVETPGGNRKLIEAFDHAGVDHPVANSLAYSIYKMIPNDTDLTVFRRDGGINGFNFAFIGDHFDYHTALDTPGRLDVNTLAHQGSYLMPLLDHFASTGLGKELQSIKGEDDVYFPLPVIGLVHFPFNWIAALISIAGVLLVVLIVIGVRRGRVSFKDVLIGFLPFLLSMVVVYLICTYGWSMVATDDFYLNRSRVFPYTGYWWIAIAAFVGLAVAFYAYSLVYHRKRVASHSVAPLFTLWLITLLIAFPMGDGGLIPGVFLPGAGFFIVPFFMGLMMLWLNIRDYKPSFVLLVVLAIPTIYIFVPFIKAFPVALGMGILFVAGILTVLVFGLLLPIMGHYRKKKLLATFSLMVVVACVVTAFAKAEFSTEQPRTSSLVYFLDADGQRATWSTYDQTLSKWVTAKMDAPQKAEPGLNTIDSKYASRFRYTQDAPIIKMPEVDLRITSDTVIENERTVRLELSSKAPVERYEVFTDSVNRFSAAVVNGVASRANQNTGEVLSYRRGGRILSCFVSDNEPQSISFSFDSSLTPEFTVYAASYDLLDNGALDVAPRPEGEIPKPFVLNDAIIRKKTIKVGSLAISSGNADE